MGLVKTRTKSAGTDKEFVMKILCTGSYGMLGEAVRKVFKDHELILTDIYDIDVRSYDSVMQYMEKLDSVPNYIWHMAAETNLEICELRPEQAYLTNTIGTFNVARLAQLLDVPIIYMSTAGIFKGNQVKPYIETDMPQPANHYGRSKYYGELALNSYDKVYIFRMSWAMGGGPKLDKKFVNKIYQLIKSGKNVLHVIDDKFGSPTYTHDVAMTIQNCLIAQLPYGVYHVAGKGKASRFDVAKAIVEILGLKVEIIPVKSEFYKSQYPCLRANNEVLESKKDFRYANVMRDWREALEEYLKVYYA